jgi:hypothetical protein
VVTVTLAFALTAVARADFTESFCDSAPSAPWTGGFDGAATFPVTVDSCTNPGGSLGLGVGIGAPSVPEGVWAAGLTAAPGETFTHATVHYSTQPVTSGSAFTLFGYNASTIDAEAAVTAPNEGDVDVDLPNATDFWGRYDCDTPGGCSMAAAQGVFDLGRITLTIHDTGAPAIAAAGGSLAADATVKGIQTLLFGATDTGSGVQRVTLSLGPNLVATATSACQTPSLAPCPGDTSGTLTTDTSLLPDGSYPVILTAYDASGDATPVQVSTVIVANHIGTVSVPIVHRGKSHGHHRRRPLTVRARFKWDWRGATTRLDFARFGPLPKRGRVVLRCTGADCPFTHLSAGRRGLKRLKHKLVNRVFRPGQTLEVTITAPHRIAERGLITIQRGALPIVSTPKKR